MTPDLIADAARHRAAFVAASRGSWVFNRPLQPPNCAGENRTGALNFAVAERVTGKLTRSRWNWSKFFGVCREISSPTSSIAATASGSNVVASTPRSSPRSGRRPYRGEMLPPFVYGSPSPAQAYDRLRFYRSVAGAALGIEEAQELLQRLRICRVPEICAFPPHLNQALIFEFFEMV